MVRHLNLPVSDLAYRTKERGSKVISLANMSAWVVWVETKKHIHSEVDLPTIQFEGV